jgi:hypothetical protein
LVALGELVGQRIEGWSPGQVPFLTSRISARLIRRGWARKDLANEARFVKAAALPLVGECGKKEH